MLDRRREDCGREAIARSRRRGSGLVERPGHHHGHDRAERLLRPHGHVGRHVGEHGRLQVAAAGQLGGRGPAPSGEHPGARPRQRRGRARARRRRPARRRAGRAGWRRPRGRPAARRGPPRRAHPGTPAPPRRARTTRSTAMHSWPALTKAPSATCCAAHTGSTPASTTSASLPPFSSSSFAARRPRHLGDAPAGPARADVGDDVDAGVGDQPLADGPVALHELQDAVGQVPRHRLGERGAGQRAPLGRLVHDGVAGGQRGAEQPRRGGERVVPRGDHRDDARAARAGRRRRARGSPPSDRPASSGASVAASSRSEAATSTADAGVGEQPAGVTGVEEGDAVEVRRAGRRRPRGGPRRGRRAPYAATSAGPRVRPRRPLRPAPVWRWSHGATSAPVAGSTDTIGDESAPVTGAVRDHCPGGDLVGEDGHDLHFPRVAGSYTSNCYSAQSLLGVSREALSHVSTSGLNPHGQGQNHPRRPLPRRRPGRRYG